ncbi:ferrous iron transport protein B [Azotobacter beijerinckii]|uniref:Ferrous iron transport protein B n=1 Tax=Azotobacter beijerinckii TaxID=170623 RepID=A0A1H6WSE1_9GAMM|nr:ferrous iron transporter B [Azotobacter beijerinckii]SEJ18154.1 ferrous iron transport protein B [Azotobacter beijerinckii]SEJ45187.1 ferrous iron transport protein B [Azotobacter beijerinckii]
MSQPVLHFALVGNPNCGKTALFNCLTGAKAKVANYAGVTVEKRSGPLAGLSRPAELIDLPGTYSLYVASPDEQVARRVILGEMAGEVRPDVLVAVIDATNIKLGLRLVLELKALGLPMVLVLNLADAARSRGINIRTELLAERLGMPVVETVAVRKNGVGDLQTALRSLAASVQTRTGNLSLPERSEAVESVYARIDALLAECVDAPEFTPRWQDKLDALVMHPVLGVAILAAILLLMFQAVFAWAAPVMDGIETLVGWLGEQVGALLPAGILHDFVVDGLIAGMGSVLVFLPQIIILFAFILALEDSGYLPRAAFLLDRMMRGVGLSGRSFIPLLSSFACAVPGIMSTRSIANPRERLVTIMTAPLMTCSARLPVYALVIGAFIPHRTVWGLFNLQGLTLFCLYIAGIASAALVAWITRQQQGEDNSFPLLLELPNYRWPNLYHFLVGLKERAWIFLSRVGTVILALSIVLWFLATFPHAPEDATLPAIEYSFAGMLGKLIQPLFEPLGFNWQMCIALIPAMAAREVAVSTLATVYAVSGGEDALGSSLAHSWTVPVALAYLAWFVYAPQCLSTIAVVRRETNSVRATLIFTGYLFALAYVAALLVRQLSAIWL